ncbi:MAG: hypothetical protein IH943_08380 [Acidobacteria bacterium]|nr:hypothetical protein [Acidobacteriota bacterium]
MTRYLMLALIGLLAVAAALTPQPPLPVPGDIAASDPPAVAVCAVEEGRGRTTSLGIVSVVNGRGRFTAFAGGRPTGSTIFETGSSGSTSIPVVDISAVGIAAGLAELPDIDTGVGSVVVGEETLSANTCASTPARQTILGGGSTLSGESLELQLMNPYAGEAVVELTVVSEVGIESSDTLATVIIPSRSSIVLDLAEILPGRATLSVIIDTIRGSVIPVGRFANDIDTAIWSATPPQQDWFLVSPGGEGRRSVIVSTSSPADVNYQIDVYGPDGLVEAMIEGVIPGRGIISVDLSTLTDQQVAIRVISTGPVASFLRLDRDSGVGLTSGSTSPSTKWLMPGAASVGESTTLVYILNPDIEDATVTVSERRSATTAEQFPVPADSLIVYEVSEISADGLAIESDVPIVATWLTIRESSLALATGVPVLDG